MIKRSIVLVSLVLLAALNCFPQSQTASGNMSGIITDATGAVLAGANITVTNVDTGVERSVVSDTAGNFRIFLLPPATYEVKVQVSGFSTYTRRPVQVTVGETVSL